MDTVEFREALRSVELRVTRPRLAVLEVLRQHPHSDTETVIHLVRAAGESVSVQGVYDVLRTLDETGLVRRIQPAGTTARYELQTAHHQHLVCRSCSTIVDVDVQTDAVGGAACLTASDDQGFRVDEAEVVFWGVCPTCAAARSDTPRSRASAPPEEPST